MERRLPQVSLHQGEVKQLVKVNILATILNIVLNIWLIPHYSYFAAALTTLITEILIFTFNVTYFCSRYSFKIPVGDFIKILLATIPGAFFLSLTDTYSLFLRVIVVIILYGGSLAVLLPKLRKALPELLLRKPPDSSLQNTK